jgi:hypothetical protein
MDVAEERHHSLFQKFDETRSNGQFGLNMSSKATTPKRKYQLMNSRRPQPKVSQLQAS